MDGKGKCPETRYVSVVNVSNRKRATKSYCCKEHELLTNKMYHFECFKNKMAYNNMEPTVPQQEWY